MKLFTGDDCPTCEAAKKYIQENNIEIEIIHIDVTTRAGRDIQMQERIMGVPVLEKDGNRYVGQDVLDQLTKNTLGQ